MKRKFKKFDIVKCISDTDINKGKTGVIMQVDYSRPFPIYIIFQETYFNSRLHKEGIFRPDELLFIK